MLVKEPRLKDPARGLTMELGAFLRRDLKLRFAGTIQNDFRKLASKQSEVPERGERILAIQLKSQTCRSYNAFNSGYEFIYRA